ncbi:Uncharacterized protein Fot_49705 [Forsythia ovata]|uniref:Uncharacterized protein n=1 Tax=Forsythia ovata TaxID=205694 RepID=A0ABD1QDL5_9LAMI
MVAVFTSLGIKIYFNEGEDTNDLMDINFFLMLYVVFFPFRFWRFWYFEHISFKTGHTLQHWVTYCNFRMTEIPFLPPISSSREKEDSIKEDLNNIRFENYTLNLKDDHPSISYGRISYQLRAGVASFIFMSKDFRYVGDNLDIPDIGYGQTLVSFEEDIYEETTMNRTIRMVKRRMTLA